MPNNFDIFPTDLPSSSVATVWPTSLFLLAVAIFLYAFLFELPMTPFFGDADQSIFLYEAERMFNGEVMYRDFFQFTLPGTQAFYALMFAIFGVKFWIISWTTLILGVATAGLMLAISKRVLPSPISFLPATIYIFFGFRWVGFDGSHRMFSPVFLLVAILFLMNGRSVKNLVMAGCSLALASFFTQQRGLVALAAALVYLLIENIFEIKRWRDYLTKSLAISASFAITLAALCAYFIIVAGSDNFIYATVVYPLKYYSYGHPNNFGVYFIDLQKAFAISKPSDILALLPVIFYCMVLPAIYSVFLVVLIRKRKTIMWEMWREIALLAAVGSFLIFTTTAPNTPRIFQISGPTLIVAIWFIHKFGPSIITTKRVTHAAIAALVLLGTLQAIRVQTNWDVVHLDLPVGRLALVASKQAERYQWLAKNTSPGDYFFEVYEPFVYFPLRLKNPTKVGQFWPSEYTRPEQIADAVSDLGKKRPKYMLWDNGYLNSAGPRPKGDNTGPLADFVEANYAPIGEIYDIAGRSIQMWEIKVQ